MKPLKARMRIPFDKKYFIPFSVGILKATLSISTGLAHNPDPHIVLMLSMTLHRALFRSTTSLSVEIEIATIIIMAGE